MRALSLVIAWLGCNSTAESATPTAVEFLALGRSTESLWRSLRRNLLPREAPLTFLEDERVTTVASFKRERLDRDRGHLHDRVLLLPHEAERVGSAALIPRWHCFMRPKCHR